MAAREFRGVEGVLLTAQRGGVFPCGIDLPGITAAGLIPLRDQIHGLPAPVRALLPADTGGAVSLADHGAVIGGNDLGGGFSSGGRQSA